MIIQRDLKVQMREITRGFCTYRCGADARSLINNGFVGRDFSATATPNALTGKTSVRPIPGVSYHPGGTEAS